MMGLAKGFTSFMFMVLAMNSLIQLNNAFAEMRNEEIKTITINDEISIEVYTPTIVDGENRDYATMYVMDSQHYFYNAIAYQKSLRNGVNVSPKFIVVGINTQKINDDRFNLLGPNADEMIKLIEKEIIPIIDNNYPSNKTRMYFGWQFAAGFGLELFTKRPDLINAYFLASSPTFTQNRLNKAAELLQQGTALNNYFYLSLGAKESHATSNYQALNDMFQQQADSNIKWKYNLSDQYTHQTTPLDSFNNGLAWYFSDYPDMTFYSLEEIETFGGVSAVVSYYKARGERYNMSGQVGPQTQLSMFRHAAQANRWDLFQQFEQHLGELEFSDDHAEGWFHFFAQFYLDNEKLPKAEKLYVQALKFYPNSHALWAALGEVYEMQNELSSAFESYGNALNNTSPQDEIYLSYQQKHGLLSEKLNIN